jgi:hypothetical protein
MECRETDGFRTLDIGPDAVSDVERFRWPEPHDVQRNVEDLRRWLCVADDKGIGNHFDLDASSLTDLTQLVTALLMTPSRWPLWASVRSPSAVP